MNKTRKKASVPVERVIYDNYDVYDIYQESAIEDLKSYDPDYEPSDEEICRQCYDIAELDWENIKADLTKFFNDNEDQWLLVGAIQRWDGTYSGGFVFDTFDELMSRAAQDCDYYKFWDENGHFYLKCSHHDGTNIFEVKKLTKDGQRFYYNWAWAPDGDKRYTISDSECYKKLFERYSVLPNFSHEMDGSKKIEWVKAS